VKVRIDAGGREVEIECADANVTADTIGEKALELWRATEGAKASEGPAYGLQAGFGPDRAATTAARRPMGVPE
jgi:hypothetical protein